MSRSLFRLGKIKKTKVGLWASGLSTVVGLYLTLIEAFKPISLSVAISLLVAIISSVLFLHFLYSSHEKGLKEIIEEAIKKVSPFPHLMQLMAKNEELSKALVKLMNYLSEVHESGSFPLFKNLNVRIELSSVYTTEELRKKGLIHGTPPNNTSWLWFEISIEEKWEVYPNPKLKDEELNSYLKSSIKSILVCEEETYHMLDRLNVLTPRVSIFYPVPNALFNKSNDFKDFLKKVNYIHEASYRIEKKGRRSSAEVLSSTKIELEPVTDLQNELLKQFPSLREKWDRIDEHYKSSIITGSLQLLKPKEIGEGGLKAVSISPSESESAWWHITFKCKYILPAKVKEGERVLLDRKMYEYPFDQVVEGVNMAFSVNEKLQNFIRLEDPITRFFFKMPERKQLQVEQVEYQVEYAYPGDNVLFRWKDNLIDRLGSQG